jgi:putative transferase (TIGR04331 family)
LGVFLATTALSQFWDKDQEILFLGSWCTRYDCRSDWETLRYQVMPSPWNDRRRYYEATLYVDELTERFLKHVSSHLNSVHGTTHSVRYWRVVIGPWLFHYLHAVYDRYIHLTEAFRHNPALETILLSPQSFRVPRDMGELMQFVSEDAYNLQIVSQVLQEMGHTFPNLALKGTRRENGESPEKKGRYAAVKKAAERGSRFAERAISGFLGERWQVALCGMYCPRSSLWAVALRMGLRALPFEVRSEWSGMIPSSRFDERRNCLEAFPASNEFERVFARLLARNCPALYLEAYPWARAETLKRHRRMPSTIVSAIGWYFNEPFKFFAAEAMEKGSRLLAIQHGGGYGIFRFSPPELHESRLADSFMAWGWASNEGGASRNLPSPKLSSSFLPAPSSRTVIPKHKTILFVATEHPRYLYRFHSTPVGSQWEGYFDWQCRFLSALPHRLRAAVRFRANPSEYGHFFPKRLAERFGEVQWDVGGKFSQRVKEVSLVVVDHCATTFLEALLANVPVIVFWDPYLWEIRDQAEPYFNSLYKAGVWWNSPEAAAAKVVLVSEDPWAWWGCNEVQDARQCFVDRFALAREGWLDDWADALEEEIVLGQKMK